MKPKQVWMSTDTQKKSHYGYRTVLGILGIVLLMILLLFAGSYLRISLGLGQSAFSLPLLLAVFALGIGLSVRMGRQSLQDASLFFLTEKDGLWVMDARGLSSHGDGFLGFAIGAMETQDFLRRQGRQPFLPEKAEQILKVLSIQDHRRHYAVRCLVSRADRRVTRRTYLIVKGIPEEASLLWQLERRKRWDPEPKENRNPMYILLSALAFAACISLCILSHPAVAKLSGELYFPCMGASAAAFSLLLYFLVRQHRGE